MDTLQFTILIVLALIAVCVVFEAKKRRNQVQANKGLQPKELGEHHSKTALEAEPTQTARMRVKDMLAKSEHLAEREKKRSSETSEDEEALPDPFSDKS